MSARTLFPQLKDADWLRQIYCEGQRSQEEIAAILGCSRSRVAQALRAHKVEMRPAGRLAVPRLDDADWLRQRYIGERMSTLEIARELKCTDGGVRKALIRHGIKARSQAQVRNDHARFARIGKLDRARRNRANDAGDVGKAYTAVIRELGRLGRAPRTTAEQNKLVDTAMHRLHEAEQALGLWLDLS